MKISSLEKIKGNGICLQMAGVSSSAPREGLKTMYRNNRMEDSISTRENTC
jgi:hypothetical protein